MKLTPAIVLAAAALAVASCSGDDSDESGAPSVETRVDSSVSATSMATSTPDDDEASPFDPAFGDEGIVEAELADDAHDRFISVATGPDGSIYAAGFVAFGDDHAFAVARFDENGEPDRSFGDGGTVTVNVAEGGGSAEVARGLVVEDDGRVLVAGPFEHDPSAAAPGNRDLDIAVVRLTADGELDASFGEGGIARIDVGPGKAVNADTFLTDNAWGLAARAGGYAVFGATPNQDDGRSDVDFAIVGITATGELDASFGTEGVVQADLGGTVDNARHLVAAPDGALLAAGYSRNADGLVLPVLIRIGADGQLDESFGTGGVASNEVLDAVTEAYQVGLQGNDYILAGYGRSDGEDTVDMVVYRFLADGSLDRSFGTDGVTRIDLAGEDDRGRNLVVLDDGSIVVVGSGKLNADDIDAMVVRLDADGAPDESFGDAGHLLVDLGGPGDAFFGVALTDDGDAVLLAGYKGADPEGSDDDDAVLARLRL